MTGASRTVDVEGDDAQPRDRGLHFGLLAKLPAISGRRNFAFGHSVRQDRIPSKPASFFTSASMGSIMGCLACEAVSCCGSMACMGVSKAAGGVGATKAGRVRALFPLCL